MGIYPGNSFVSDGGDVTRSQGWLNKMMIRWNSAPSIADWEKRIVTRLPNELPAGYLKARGRISRNLTYCQLLSGRLTLSRQEALKYGRYFVKDSIGKLMNMTKHTPITWWMLAKLLQYRSITGSSKVHINNRYIINICQEKDIKLIMVTSP